MTLGCAMYRLRLVFVLSLCVTPVVAQSPYRTQKGTEVLWDKWGVPHVLAKSIPDMFFCYGWVQAEAHGDLLLHSFGNSRGRAAEYFGPGVAEGNIKNDRWV